MNRSVVVHCDCPADKYDRSLTLGDRAAQDFGFTEDMVRAMAHGMGHKPTLEILARIGRGLTEHS